MKMLKFYDKKDRIKFLILKAFVVVLTISLGFLAVKMADVNLVTMEEKLQVGIGLSLITVLIVIALFGSLGKVIRTKSVGFVIGFIVFFLLRHVVDALTLGFGFLSIPLLLDDLMIRPYFKFLNMGKYWQDYKYMVKRDE